MSKKQRKSSVKNGNQMTSQALQQISNSLAYLVVNSGNLKGKKQQELVPILSDLGFNKKVIATVLQASPESVSEQLSELKTARKQTRKNSNGHGEGETQSETPEQAAS